MVNPEIIEASATKIKWEESCLSVPDLAQNVERSDKIVIRFQGADGAEHERTYEGFSAVVMQHELDHLQGVTLLEHSSKGDEGVESIARHMFDNTNGAWGTSPITRSVVPRTAGMYSLQRFHFPGRIPAFARATMAALVWSAADPWISLFSPL
jgi:hypothetical protein